MNKQLATAIRTTFAQPAGSIKGFVLWEGPSQLTGDPVVMIATLNSNNVKTGNMIQIWYLRRDMHPVQATQSGDDIAICGGCMHRPSLGGACYVNVGQAPASIYKAYKRGAYPKIDVTVSDYIWAFFFTRYVRFGAYGDPASVPFEITSRVLQHAIGFTGYTHQAGHPNYDQRYDLICMTSVDTVKQALKVQSEGGRYFRVKTAEGELLENEIICPSETVGAKCENCRLCAGLMRGTEPNIVITVHGAKAGRYESKYAKQNLIPLEAVA